MHKDSIVMKKYSLLFLFVFFLFACSDSKTDMPRLELKTIFLNGGEEDYSRNLEEIPPLRQSDYINVSFSLDGNGTDLNTFIVENKNENISAVIIPSLPDEISEELTDKEEILRYKDGVQSTSVEVKLTVQEAKEEGVSLHFYLNSKAPDSEGAKYLLVLETTVQPREVEEE
jgi:hypothetical protein